MLCTEVHLLLGHDYFYNTLAQMHCTSYLAAESHHTLYGSLMPRREESQAEELFKFTNHPASQPHDDTLLEVISQANQPLSLRHPSIHPCATLFERLFKAPRL
ncbi:hypothetical protein SNK05_000784 [Fusarium graminearum]